MGNWATIILTEGSVPHFEYKICFYEISSAAEREMNREYLNYTDFSNYLDSRKSIISSIFIPNYENLSLILV